MRNHSLILWCAAVATISGCSALLEQPPACYQSGPDQRRCFATERELSEDVARRQRLAIERATEERAKQMALAIVAERDAKEAAAKARSAVDRTDRIQDDAFEILVEIHEDAVSRVGAETPSSPESAPAQQ